MKGLLACVALCAAAVAHSQPVNCDEAPYGDTRSNVTAILALYRKAAANHDADNAIAQVLRYELTSALKTACLAKFKGDADALSELHRVGISDALIAIANPAMLANSLISAKTQHVLNEQSEERSSSASSESYQHMTVRNFVIDGPKLAEQGVKVQLTGSYLLSGAVGLLFADEQAVIMQRYNPDVATQPSVPLLTTDASHQLRARLSECQSNPSTAQVGCPLAVRGTATTCTVTNQFGAAHQVPCVHVEN